MTSPAEVLTQPALRPATRPPDDRDAQRLLVIDPEGGPMRHLCIGELATLLDPGDVLVLNDAATLPASFVASTPRGERIELRLARERDGEYWALLLGEGDFRRRTEDRGPPPELRAGERLTITDGKGETTEALDAVVTGTIASRLVTLRFESRGRTLWDALYRAGRPIQYAYVERPLALWDVQNVFGARPWAFELPSAARGLTWSTLLSLRRRGIELVMVTHAAGISSTGSPELDRLLPLPERSEVPERTVDAIERARARGSRIVAAGTTVVRALESAAQSGHLVAGTREATHVIGPDSHLRIVDSILSGIHSEGESHHRLLQAFAPGRVLSRAEALAARWGYRTHEFGDACLILRRPGGRVGDQQRRSEVARQDIMWRRHARTARPPFQAGRQNIRRTGEGTARCGPSGSTRRRGRGPAPSPTAAHPMHRPPRFDEHG